MRLSSGTRLEYDALVLAIGARATANIAGALTFRGQDDVPQLRRLLEKMDAGDVLETRRFCAERVAGEFRRDGGVA